MPLKMSIEGFFIFRINFREWLVLRNFEEEKTKRPKLQTFQVILS